MLQAIVDFFKAPPPAMDPTFIPWLTALIAGNIIVGTALWALLKYIAKNTPWAVDDKIIQIITGGWGAIKDAVGKIKKKPVEEPIELVEEVQEATPPPPESPVCPSCGHLIDGSP